MSSLFTLYPRQKGLIHRWTLGYELSNESPDVVGVVEQEEDGEADGEAEDDGEHNQDFPKMFRPPTLVCLCWAL